VPSGIEQRLVGLALDGDAKNVWFSVAIKFSFTRFDDEKWLCASCSLTPQLVADPFDQMQTLLSV
jgi:hypothetical protein